MPDTFHEGPVAPLSSAVLRHLSHAWPDSVALRLDDRIPMGRGEYVTASGWCELFVYKDAATLGSWDGHGRTDANAAGLVHLIAGADGLTVVSEDLPLSDELGATLRSLRMVS